MRLFVVEDRGDLKGADGRYETLETFTERLGRDWTTAHVRALDEALLAVINVAHVGMVIPYRRGWVFCAEDAPP